MRRCAGIVTGVGGIVSCNAVWLARGLLDPCQFRDRFPAMHSIDIESTELGVAITRIVAASGQLELAPTSFPLS